MTGLGWRSAAQRASEVGAGKSILTPLISTGLKDFQGEARAPARGGPRGLEQPGPQGRQGQWESSRPDSSARRGGEDRGPKVEFHALVVPSIFFVSYALFKRVQILPGKITF